MLLDSVSEFNLPSIEVDQGAIFTVPIFLPAVESNYAATRNRRQIVDDARFDPWQSKLLELKRADESRDNVHNQVLDEFAPLRSEYNDVRFEQRKSKEGRRGCSERGGDEVREELVNDRGRDWRMLRRAGRWTGRGAKEELE